MNKIKSFVNFLSLGALAIFGAIYINYLNTYSLEEIAKKTSDNIQEKSILALKAADYLSKNGFEKIQQSTNNLFETEQIGLYYFIKDSLAFWNNCQIPINEDLKFLENKKGFVKLKHGYYLYAISTDNNVKAVALCLIKPIFEIQNKYLKNDFVNWCQVPKDIEITLNTQSSSNVFFENKIIFSLTGKDINYNKTWVVNACYLLFFIGFLMILSSIILTVKNGLSSFKFIAVITTVVFIKFLMFYFSFPKFFYTSYLYDLEIFGNAKSYINSYLGDILFNSIIVLFLAVALHLQLKNSTTKFLNKIILAFLIFIIINQYTHTLISLINNSTLNFDLLSNTNIKLSTYIGLFILGIYSLALFIALNKLILFFNGRSLKVFCLFFSIILIICIVQQFFSDSFNFIENYWLLVFSSLLFWLVKFNYSKIIYGLGLQILIMSVITSLFLSSYILKNQKKDLDLLSSKLAKLSDATLEREYENIPNKINADQNLQNLISLLPNSEKEVEQLLKQKYFSGYFNLYSIDFSLFDFKCAPILKVRQPVFLNEGFFEDQIQYNSDSTSNKGLFFIKKHKGNTRYVGKINLKDKNLYVLMESKQLEDLGSFPDLLLDLSQQKQDKYKTVSYAVYRLGNKVSQFGDFNFPYTNIDSFSISKVNPNFSIYSSHPDKYTEILISQKNKTWVNKITYNSYLFLIFSIISCFIYFYYLIIFKQHLNQSTLTRRIQVVITILLVFALITIGFTSSSLVKNQYQAQNKKQLREKTEILINELTLQFKSETLFDSSQTEFINLKLKEYARIFNADISLFNKQGFLINTSQPKLYELGLASTFANPFAFYQLSQKLSLSENTNEKAGNLDFISQYTPIINSKKQVLGFINLPYFSKQSDLENELSTLNSTLINLYVILLLISIIAGLILSSFITHPLRLIKKQFEEITLGKENKKIIWPTNDEIGQLVLAYNMMLIKLEESANLLAQSERESAWREMAKQVAHEIKNPLTPVKLNLQHLQNLLKNDPNDFKTKFNKITDGIIEQIDSLATIANEFSNFAKLPSTQLQKINLVEVINASVLIFENHKNILITNSIKQPQLFILGDKDQCLRVFNNVFKNAVQALEQTTNPTIVILCQLIENEIIISICDNGRGIAEELKTKIFQPNFTTKTSGSGLGLAIVNNYMLGFGGKIWFESDTNIGTTFYLRFLKHEF